MSRIADGIGTFVEPGPHHSRLREILNHLKRLRTGVNDSLPKDGSEAMTAQLELATYTVATRPTASSFPGAIIYVSDGGAGAVFQGSDGAAWVNLG